MIASLRGELAHVGKDTAVVDVNGVGYQVLLSQRHLNELPPVGEPVRLHTHLVHREDAMILIGFPSLEERELFLLLTGVSSVGAKTALGVLSALTVPDVVAAVVGNDPRALARAPGVGKKTAERIVLELREKLREWEPSREALPTGTRRVAAALPSAEASETELALYALGYTEDEVYEALKAVGEMGSVEDTLRRALAYLSKF
ncbi:MAG: Holliday junction helicase RuvA [Cyanobacteria bacterium RYN_339]|nr:Holliday junction helicase RuvA [Cyanobacteria bacterium RYN_339]